VERGCEVWDAVAVVRHELEPIRKTLRNSLADPSRIRPRLVRRDLGSNRPDTQLGFGLGIAMISASFSRSIRSRQVTVVQRLEDAVDTLPQAIDDLCRLARLEVPVITSAVSEIDSVVRRLAL